MLTLRLTQKALKKFKLSPVSEPSGSTTLLGDWYVNIFHFRRRPLVIAVSERTFLPVIFPAIEARPLRDRISLGAQDMLEALGVPREVLHPEISAMWEGDVAKTNSRQVLGVMTDFVHMIMAGDGLERSFLESSLWLAGTPCSPLEMGSPIEATCALFDAPPLERPPRLRLVPSEPETKPPFATLSSEDALKAFKFSVEWNERAGAYLGMCLQIPELCHIDSSPGRALSGIRRLVLRGL